MSNNEDKIVEPNRRNIVSDDDLVDCWLVVIMVFNGFLSCNLKIIVARETQFGTDILEKMLFSFKNLTYVLSRAIR